MDTWFEDKRHQGCPEHINLGLHGRYQVQLKSGAWHYCLENSLIQAVGGEEKIKRVWHGIKDTYVVECPDGSLKWSLEGNYRNLASWLEKRGGINVSPLSFLCFFFPSSFFLYVLGPYEYLVDRWYYYGQDLALNIHDRESFVALAKNGESTYWCGTRPDTFPWSSWTKYTAENFGLK